MGIGPMAAIAAAVLSDPPELGRASAVVPLAMAAVYLPAVWGSVAATERRRAILRGSSIASLVVAFLGAALFGFVVLVALMPATAMLWLASGGRRWGR